MVLVWILAGFLIYWVGIVWLERTGFLERYNMDTAGPLLMIRTLRGREFLNKLSKPKKFWRVYGNLGVVLTVIMMAIVFVLLFLVGYSSIVSPPEPQKLNEPKNILAIPGINDFLPLSMAPFIVAGLAIGIIVHEGGHGLMCRVGNIGISSMGLVNLAFFPIGAFVEPDEEEVEEADPGSRTRMFAAGIMNNSVLTVVVFILLAVSMMGIVPIDGVGVQGVTTNTTADDAGLSQGDVVISVEGQNVSTSSEYRDIIENQTLGESFEMTVKTDGRIQTKSIRLLDQRGAIMSGVVEDSPADQAGLGRGYYVTAVNGEPVENPRDLYSRFENVSEGEEFVIEYKNGSEGEVRNATMTYQAPDQGPPLGIYTFTVTEIVGITPYNTARVHGLLSSLNPFDWLTLIFLPFTSAYGGSLITVQFAGFAYQTSFFELNGLASLFGGLYWVIPNLLFWTAWINFNLAFFNCTPAIPLDGGHILREGVRKGVSPFFSGDRLENIADTVTVAVAVLMFGSILVMFAAPRLL